jgi:cytochrome c-type biogenesis protein CcmH
MSDTPPSPQDQLRQLQGLRDAGVLGPAEYTAALERLALASAAPSGGSTADAGLERPAAAAQARMGRRVVLATLLFTLAVGLGGYGVRGEFAAAWNPAAREGDSAQGGTPTAEEVAAMVERLAQRLQERPDDAQGWAMLARSYLMLGRLDEAAQASARALQLQPDDAQALADHADVLAMKNGRTLEGEPMRLIERALQLDPDHVKALALAGAAAFDRGDLAEAARTWDRVALLAPPGSEVAQQARDGATEARRVSAQRAAGSQGPAGTPAVQGAPGLPSAPGAAAVATARVAGTVTLAAALRARARPEDTVFVFARSAEAGAQGGGRMPLAILRAQVKDLPLQFTLDDSLAMGPGTGLSTAQRVVIGARVSRSGQATPQAGDLEGFSAAVDVGAGDVRLEIATVRP